MLIYYVHHGERDRGDVKSQDDKLTKIGEKDAINVGKMIYSAYKKNRTLNKLKAIYSSPYYRCKRTAELINRDLNLEIYEDNQLNEHDGRYETWEECQERVRKCLFDIVSKYDDNDVVICVTSGVNLAAFTSLAYKLKPSKDAPFMSVSSCSIIGFNLTKKNFQ